MLYFLICDAWIAVFQIDRAAFDKAVFGKRLLHGKIVRVRVDFQILTFCECVIEACLCNASAVYRHGNAVDHTVRTVIEPRAINVRVGGIVTKEVAEYAKNIIFIHAKIESPFCNVLLQKRPLRVSPCPLACVSLLSHERACALINLQNTIQIG